MFIIEIPFDPVPWSAPRLARGHAYDPKEKDKRAIRYLVKQQYDKPPMKGFVALTMCFAYPMPKSASKKKREAMLAGHIIPTKSDCTNCQKLYEDCLKNIVFEDDRNVALISSMKLYSEKGQVIIKVWPLEEFNEMGRLVASKCKL